MQAERSAGLRLMVYDRTCTGKRLRPGLSHAWASGQYLYKGLRRIDASIGVDSWEAGLQWLATVEPDRPIAEIQYWGHGKWGSARVGKEVFDRGALKPMHRWSTHFDAIAGRLLPEAQSLLWFRTCETLGAQPGHDFAQHLTDRLGCRVAGHTYIIGHWQSGLHSLGPGQTPSWSVEEGLREGSPQEPKAAFWSKAWHPNTISFLHGKLPAGW